MKTFFVGLLFLLQFTPAFGQDYNEKYGKPLVVLVETNPWLMVIGSDVPSFALYENGQIIYKKTIEQQEKYFAVKESKEKISEIIKTCKITDSLMLLPFYIMASEWTDQPTNVLTLNFDTLKQIAVYGRLRDPKNEARDKTPKCFLNIFDSIVSFKSKNALEWLPDSIEIMASSYSYSGKKPAKWLENCGDLKSPTTVKRSADLYSIYIDKKYFQEFLALQKKLKRGQAVEINGEKFSLYYRFPFPNVK